MTKSKIESQGIWCRREVACAGEHRRDKRARDTTGEHVHVVAGARGE